LTESDYLCRLGLGQWRGRIVRGRPYLREGKDLSPPSPGPGAEESVSRDPPPRSAEARVKLSPLLGTAWVADEHLSACGTDLSASGLIAE